MFIKIGKTYRNGRGEAVKIVGPYFNSGPYVFIGDNDWTYTEDGVYDEMDPQPSDDNILEMTNDPHHRPTERPAG